MSKADKQKKIAWLRETTLSYEKLTCYKLLKSILNDCFLPPRKRLGIP